MQTQIVILAAGKGRRMGDIDLPKVLFPLHGKPLIFPLLEQVSKLSTHPAVIVVGFKRGEVMKVLGPRYTYAFQKEQLGTAHAVWCAKPKINSKNILVLNGDMPFMKASSMEKLINLHQEQKPVISMFTSFVPDFKGALASLDNYGRIIRDSYGNIVKVTEYKDATEQERKIKEVNPGIYVFNAEWLWSHIDLINNNNAQNEFYLTDIIEVAISESFPIRSIPIGPAEVIGINTMSQLEIGHKINQN
jgi:bifunctional UDP-N-acetylglucosamine pyrophosphorylase / glucosamine-1-phosphate N-acetyltransferase